MEVAKLKTKATKKVWVWKKGVHSNEMISEKKKKWLEQYTLR